MFRGLLQYVPLVPLILAVLLFVLMPFDEARADKGELVKVTATDGGTRILQEQKTASPSFYLLG